MKPTTRQIPKPLVILAILITLLILFGCSPEVVVRDREVKIPVPVIEETLDAIDPGFGVYSPGINDEGFYSKDTIGNIDPGFIQGIKSNGIDTSIDVKYFPKLKKFSVKVKPDSVVIHDIDTLKVIKKEVVEMKWYSKLGLILIGCGVMGIIGIALLIWRKF